MNLEIAGYKIRPFVVVVPELPERTEFILRHFAEVGIVPEVFNGLSATHSGLRTVHTYEFDNPGSGWVIGAKEVATWISFYMLWQALNLQPDDYFLTLEWDAQFPANWRAGAETALRNVPPDFDMLLLGSCCAMDKPRVRLAGNVWNVRWPFCGHATILARKAIPRILETQRKVYAPLDLSLAFHTFPTGLNVYTVLPRLVNQFNTCLPE